MAGRSPENPMKAALGPTQTEHDKLLIVDFGSQVTQLIARRVREAGVYCEIAPFQSAAKAFAELRPKAVILSGGPASVPDAGSPRAPGRDLSIRRAGARHLLWPDDDGRAARRRGRERPSPRVRPRRRRGQRDEPAARGRLAAGLAASRLDEPRRPHHAPARGLQDDRRLAPTRRTR